MILQAPSPLTPQSRRQLVAALAERFPAADPACADWDAQPRGGRAAALEALERIDPVAYAATRNHVGGRVTGLSPWIRHGVLGLAEVRDRALALAGGPSGAEKLVSELAWRDYWHRVEGTLGDRIRAAIEPPAAVPRAPWGAELPADVAAAATGVACIDGFARKLVDTGHLHNHERMWLAAWLVHVRGVDWRAGADWFLRHLVDGDPASNHLSWQWVAGTFSAKPYLARRRTIEGCTDGVHCRGCALAEACPFDGDDDTLAAAMFRGPASRPSLRIPPSAPWRPATEGPPPTRPLVWLSLDAASTVNPALLRHPDAPRVHLVDPAWLQSERPSLKRLVFLFECLAEVPGVLVGVGEPAEVLPVLATRMGCDGVAAAETTCPRVRHAGEALARRTPLSIHAWPRFADVSAVRDLGRFSRYWQAVRDSALRPTPAGG